MKKIYLRGKNNNKYVLVDDENFEELNKYKWFLSRNGYAYRHKLRRINGKLFCKSFLMAREIMKPKIGFQVDHINRNKLDNQKYNLRIVTPSQNCHNQKIKINNKSGFPGVCWRKDHNRFVVTIRIDNGKRKYIGEFLTALEGSFAYEKAKKEYLRYGHK